MFSRGVERNDAVDVGREQSCWVDLDCHTKKF